MEADVMIFEAAKRPVRKPLVTLCGWCPDARERTLAAARAGNDVSHGMCPACSEKMNAELDGKAKA